MSDNFWIYFLTQRLKTYIFIATKVALLVKMLLSYIYALGWRNENLAVSVLSFMFKIHNTMSITWVD